MTPDMFVYLDLTWKSVVCKTQQKTALSNTWNDKQQTKPKNEGKKKWYNIWYIRFPLNMIKTGSVKPDRLTSAHNVVSHKAFKFTPYTWNLTFQKHGVFSNHVRTKIISNTTGTISHPHWLQITVHLDCLQNERVTFFSSHGIETVMEKAISVSSWDFFVEYEPRSVDVPSETTADRHTDRWLSERKINHQTSSHDKRRHEHTG